MQDKKVLIIISLGLVVAFAGYLSLVGDIDVERDTSVEKSLEAEWETFVSEEYDFSLQYPNGEWTRAEDPDGMIVPKYSFFIQSEGVPMTAPFNHFANVTAVSVYPHGIPTDGLLGETKPLPDNWSDKFSDESMIYVLRDGTPFAAYLRLQETPESWEPYGFVWVRLRVEGMEVVCMLDGEEMSRGRNCDPWAEPGIEIVREGNVDATPWSKLKKSAETIKFQ